MGLFRRHNGKQQRLLDCQKIIMPNSPNKLVMTEKQILHAAEQQAINDLRIIQDSNKIISNTLKPDTFFSRLDLLKEKSEHLKKLEPYVNFSGASPTDALQEIMDKEQDAIYNFIIRYYNSIWEKAESLKTPKGKQNQFQKFYTALQPYYNKMNKRNINYIEYKYKNTHN